MPEPLSPASTLHHALAVISFLLPVQAGAAGLCGDLFMAPGTATYRTVSAAGTSTSTEHFVFGTARVTQTTTGPDANNVVSTWTCTPRGLYLVTTGNAMTGDAGAFPSVTLMKVGYTWTRQSRMGMAQITSVNRVADQERVTTPAGTFTALRVESDITTSDITTGVSLPAGTKLPPGTDASALGGKIHTTAWYARGTGLIKSQSDAGTSTTLLKFSR